MSLGSAKSIKCQNEIDKDYKKTRTIAIIGSDDNEILTLTASGALKKKEEKQPTYPIIKDQRNTNTYNPTIVRISPFPQRPLVKKFISILKPVQNRKDQSSSKSSATSCSLSNKSDNSAYRGEVNSAEEEKLNSAVGEGKNLCKTISKQPNFLESSIETSLKLNKNSTPLKLAKHFGTPSKLALGKAEAQITKKNGLRYNSKYCEKVKAIKHKVKLNSVFLDEKEHYKTTSKQPNFLESLIETNLKLNKNSTVLKLPKHFGTPSKHALGKAEAQITKKNGLRYNSKYCGRVERNSVFLEEKKYCKTISKQPNASRNQTGLKSRKNLPENALETFLPVRDTAISLKEKKEEGTGSLVNKTDKPEVPSKLDERVALSFQPFNLPFSCISKEGCGTSDYDMDDMFIEVTNLVGENTNSKNREVSKADETNALDCSHLKITETEKFDHSEFSIKETCNIEQELSLEKRNSKAGGIGSLNDGKLIFNNEESSTLGNSETPTSDSEKNNTSEGKETSFVAIDKDQNKEYLTDHTQTKKSFLKTESFVASDILQGNYRKSESVDKNSIPLGTMNKVLPSMNVLVPNKDFEDLHSMGCLPKDNIYFTPLLSNIPVGIQQNSTEASVDTCNSDVPNLTSNYSYIDLQQLLANVEDTVIVVQHTMLNSKSFKCVKCWNSFSELKDCCNHSKECMGSSSQEKNVLACDILWVCTVCYNNFEDNISFIEHKNSCLVPSSSSISYAVQGFDTVTSDLATKACFSLNPDDGDHDGHINTNKKDISVILGPVQDLAISKVTQGESFQNSTHEFTCPTCKKILRCSYDSYVQHLHQHLEGRSKKTPAEQAHKSDAVANCSNSPQILPSVTETSILPPVQTAETEVFPSEAQHVSKMMPEVGLVQAKKNKSSSPNLEKLDLKPRIVQKLHQKSRYIPGYCDPCGQVLQLLPPSTGGSFNPLFKDGKFNFASKLVCKGCGSKQNMTYSLPSKILDDTYQYHYSKFYNSEQRIIRKNLRFFKKVAARNNFHADSFFNSPCTSTLTKNTDSSNKSTDHITPMDTDLSTEEKTSCPSKNLHYFPNLPESKPGLHYTEKKHPDMNCNILSSTSSFQEIMDIHNVDTLDKTPDLCTVGSNDIKIIDDIMKDFWAICAADDICDDDMAYCIQCLIKIPTKELISHFKTNHSSLIIDNTINVIGYSNLDSFPSVKD